MAVRYLSKIGVKTEGLSAPPNSALSATGNIPAHGQAMLITKSLNNIQI